MVAAVNTFEGRGGIFLALCNLETDRRPRSSPGGGSLFMISVGGDGLWWRRWIVGGGAVGCSFFWGGGGWFNLWDTDGRGCP